MSLANEQDTGPINIKSAVDLMTQDQDEGPNRGEEVERTSETDPPAESNEEFDEQPDDLDSSEDAEGEIDDDEDLEASDQEDDDDQGDSGIVYDVPLPDGQVVTIPEDELVTGYLRQVDFTRGKQQLAEQGRAMQGELQQAREARDRYLGAVQELEQQLETNYGLNDELLQSNPQEYYRRKEARDRVQEERKKVEQERDQDDRKRFGEYVAYERHMVVQAIPEWQDEAVAKEERAQLREFALRHGYREDEIARVVDHRNVKILRMAMMAERGEQTKKSVAKKKVAKVKPRPKSSRHRPKPRFTRRVEQAQKAFDKAGRGKKQIEAGVDLLLAREAQAEAKRNRRR